MSFVLAGGLMFLSIRHFMEKGILMNNAYLYASPDERKTMDKKPHYRQSAICFFLASIAAFCFGFHFLFDNTKIGVLGFIILAAAFVYSIASSVKHYRENQ